MNMLTCNYHDNLEKYPAKIVIDREEAHGGMGAYHRLRFGYDLTIFITAERLLELGEIIAAALLQATAETATQVEKPTTAVEAAELFDRGAKLLAGMESASNVTG